MEQELRTALRRTVNKLRALLYDSVLDELEGTYGIRPDGTRIPAEEVPPLQQNPELARRREEIVAALDHEEKKLTGSKPEERALEIFALEAAFTLLNRLAALKLMERRDLVPECVSNKDDSRGFKDFRELTPVLVRSLGDQAYRRFLDLLFDDIASEIRLLFDRSLPPSHVFPPSATLHEALALLNAEEIEEAWDEDEALGWVYQYFTPEDLRKKVRDESSAPRNTYELAIRNQFYTPDYVVRFLTENTLGRLWWEMNPGTSIKDRDFLVYREDEEPNEREPRDPRQLKVLDPACGSGHFLHYAFELLQVIYREAYDGHAAGAGLREDYPDAAEFERMVPALILENNLYGIDIDFRATQLTALSLYLRAKAAHPDAPIRRVNAVLAAAMPGEEDLFEEFLEAIDSPEAELIRVLLRKIWDEIGHLAGEAGSLLKPENAIREHIQALRERVETESGRQLGLDGFVPEEYKQETLSLERMPDEQFWEGLEQRLLDHLAAYAASAESNGVSRRLFVDDAAHGIAFIDALMHEYDVVLMNPPFGAASKPSKKYIDRHYPRTKNDMYAAFVERGLELLRTHGLLGAITSRTGFFLSSFQKWREEILLEETEIVTFADLGQGVLDTAMVEVAAYALERVA